MRAFDTIGYRIIRGVYGTVARTSGKGRRRTGQEE